MLCIFGIAVSDLTLITGGTMKTFAIILFTLITLTACGENQQKSRVLEQQESSNSSSPFLIEADSLMVNNELGTAVFKGRVVVKNNRIDLRADQVTVYYNENLSEMERILADGHAYFKVEGNKGRGEIIDLELTKHLVTILSENQPATLERGEDKIMGQKILLTLDEDNRAVQKVSVHQGEKQRAHVIISAGTLEDMK